MPFINKPVPGADQYYPLNEPVAIGSAFTDVNVYPQNKNIPKLFEPLTIKGVMFKNRIFVAPMCQYSSDNGHATDWHLVHLGSYATRGAGAICIEATAVVPEGRISPEDAGLWTDSQIAPLKRIVKFAHAHATPIGIQLAHAGRKASTYAPWVHSDVAHSWHAPSYTAQKNEGGWEVDGPSDIPFSDLYPIPKPLTEEGLKTIEDGFVAAIKRCKIIGFDFIELHFAHGYLAHSFLSPLSNDRADHYGGEPLENRMRWPLKVASICRKEWADKPLFVRISASDWAEDHGPEKGEDGKWKWWGIEQSKVFVSEMEKIGVDLVDASSGGLYVKQNIPLKQGYQVHFSEAIKKAVPNMQMGTVGLITSPTHAESIIREGKADVVFLARELIRTPHWPLYAAEELGVAVKAANQYERGWMKMLTPAKDKIEEVGQGKQKFSAYLVAHLIEMSQKVVLCGAGFLGSYIARALAANTSYALPRHIQLISQNPIKLHAELKKEMSEKSLLPPVKADIRKPDSLDHAFEGADVVVSLVGIMHGSPKMFEDIQWRGAQNVAVAAKKQGAKVVHISAIGADAESCVPYARTKALGEQAVRQTCPDATVIRPSLLFGPGDGFFARFATLSKYLPFLPVFGGGTTRFQPVYVRDVARAVEIASRIADQEAMKATNGKIFEAGGPDVFTYREIMQAVSKYTGRSRPILSLPYSIGKLQGLMLEQLPPNIFTLTRAQVEQLKVDNIVNPSALPGYASFPDLLRRFGGEPLRSIDEILPKYL
ncbi:hypothetical protein EW145_g3437 [Phellinidium pouzarii]|uniref:NADH:flavin oxidoreductase/NADH oxidase N-terminal domain-containing protein n=1 Tax=Phellinidium pouzarii TaxID=167371 RepID=A0A4V6S177_9AGAM|nr:hypothetical protein EW145_g3437 [Phellinidium pouzarii]